MADADALNLRRYDAYPRATDHIDAMLDLIRRLEAGGYAYDTRAAVYFDVGRFPRLRGTVRQSPGGPAAGPPVGTHRS
jgi:cysteinyl-tRNA synthetase